MQSRLAAIVVLPLLAALAACTNSDDLDRAPVALGDFSLGHNVVVAPHPVKGPLSRDASEEAWIAELSQAIDERFSRYDGARVYHLGVSIDGYVLAQPGIPLVLSPKSVLILNVTAWDDAGNRKLNPEPEQITVFESLSGETLVGSGLTQSKEQQMRNLSRNAAKLIQNWLLRRHRDDGWFTAQAGGAMVESPPLPPASASPGAAAPAGSGG